MIKCGDSTLIDKGGDMSLDDISLTKEKKETTTSTPLKKLRAGAFLERSGQLS
jgi:hypothetical protein